MEIAGVLLQAAAIVVSIAALGSSRISRGKRLAERAEASLRLAASLSNIQTGASRKLDEAEATASLIAELSDDARVNTARYLQSGRGLGIRSPLIALGATYFFLFGAMGLIQLLSSPTASQRLAGTITIILAAVSGLLAACGVVNRASEHRALRSAGLPVATTWRDLRGIANSVHNRLIIRRMRARRRPGGPTPAAQPE